MEEVKNSPQEVDFFLQEVKTSQDADSEQNTLQIKQFLVDTFYKNNAVSRTARHPNKKINVLNKGKKSYDQSGRGPLSNLDISAKYYALVDHYITKTNDYVTMKNIVIIFLEHDEDIRVKTLGLRLLRKYLGVSTAIKSDELFLLFVPIIMQFFHYIPPHFKVDASLDLLTELFKVFDVIFSVYLDLEKDFTRKHELILEIYSENVLSLILPTLLLSKHENSELLTMLLDRLLQDYLNKQDIYLVNISRILTLFKPLITFPDYVNILQKEVVALIVKVLEKTPFLDSSEDDFYKYNIIAYYILFSKYYTDDKKDQLLLNFHSNITSRYGDCDMDIRKILDSI